MRAERVVDQIHLDVRQGTHSLHGVAIAEISCDFMEQRPRAADRSAMSRHWRYGLIHSRERRGLFRIPALVTRGDTGLQGVFRGPNEVLVGVVAVTHLRDRQIEDRGIEPWG